MTVFTLMVQGTTSDAGKSTLVAALCRVWVRNKHKVVPFKPQNMALNSAVTEDGGEIGRAQALQAQACYLAPHTDMNPILIKPNSDMGAQIIVHGQALKNMQARDFHRYKPEAMRAVLASYERLQQQYDWVMVEGAGSPAEINLREGDIANMGFAEAADCPVIIVADIDRGGVFAHLVGTLALLSDSERARVVGFVINRFRGDIALLQNGLDWLEERTGVPVLGVVPYLHDLFLDAEDAVHQRKAVAPSPSAKASAKLSVVVPVLPRISNHTDFDALQMHPHVDLRFVSLSDEIPACDLLILPGSKNAIDDLAALREHGWGEAIARHLRYGGKLIGICGGLQMLGESIADPLAVETDRGHSAGLGYLPLATELTPHKRLTNVAGLLTLPNSQTAAQVKGYEIHCGISTFLGTTLDTTHGLHRSPAFPLVLEGESEADTAIAFCSADNQIFATYLHGVFDHPEACAQLLAWAGLAQPEVTQAFDWQHEREQQLERLADVMAESIDLGALQQRVEDFYLKRVAN